MSRIMNIIDEVKVSDGGHSKTKLLQLKPMLEDEMRRVARHYEEVERLRGYLNTKVETVE